ncbi:BREX-3 system P-loop-containing protein BrxF [Methanogenium cariaci]|jgi:hypothetical protein
MLLDKLLGENQNNHYKMLVIIDNNNQYERITSRLDGDGWSCYDVTKNVISLIEDIPENKRKVRVGSKIKTWFSQLPDKVILYNTNILYSPELGKLNPIGAFKYRSRTKEIIVFVEGHISGDRIQYSEYGRPDFVEMDVSELIHAKLEDIDD